MLYTAGMQQIELPKPIEETLQRTIFPDLEKGRKDFDLPHTQAVVFWMRTLLAQLADPALDPKILITAAYAHDWGYIGLFDGFDSNDPQVITTRKAAHMERGAELITNLLQHSLSEFFSQEEIQAVAHLVRIHDLVEQVVTTAEVLIMEADTLGMLDVDRVTPTFTPEENARFIKEQIYNRRLLYFQHAAAKRIAEELAEKRRTFFE